MHKLSERGVIHLLLPLILLLGLIAAVFLVTSGNPLKLFSKAANNPIVFKNVDGSSLPLNSSNIPQSTSTTVRVELTSTLGSPVGVPATTARTSVLGVSEQISSLNQTINLSAGWDSIGLTVSKANYKAEDLLVEFNTQLSSSGSRATQIVRWNSSRQEFHTLGQQANNFNIIPGEGYQIRTTKGGRVTISGDQAAVSSININQGYASFSLPSVPDSIKTAEDLLQEMKKQGITANLISRWKDGRWDSHVINFPANNYQIEPGKGYLIRNTGAAKTFNIPSPSSTPSPIPSSSPVPSSSTTPVGTRYYKIAENPTDLDTAVWQVYDSEPKVVDYTFKDTAPGAKFIWVEFKASDDRTDRKSAQVEILVPSSSPTPSPTPSPTIRPTPTPILPRITTKNVLLVSQFTSGTLAETSGNITLTYSDQVDAEGYTTFNLQGQLNRMPSWIKLHINLCYLNNECRYAALDQVGSSTININNLAIRAFNNASRYVATIKITSDFGTNPYMGQYNPCLSLTQPCLSGNVIAVSATPSPTPISTIEPTPTPSPTPSPTSKRVFLSDPRTGGDTGIFGVGGLDDICQSLANNARLGGAWKAWASDDRNSAASRLTHSNLPYKLLDRTTIADNWNDLIDGTLKAPINIDMNGQQVLYGFSYVWTGTTSSGAISSNGTCLNWQSDESRGGIGDYWESGRKWTESGSYNCRNFARLYCFEQ